MGSYATIEIDDLLSRQEDFSMVQNPTHTELIKQIRELENEVANFSRSEKALRKNEERYRSMFEKSGAASIVIANDMTISMANPEFEKLTGYSKNEIEGKIKWTAFIVDEDLERMKGYHVERRKPESRAPEEYECQLLNRHGERKNILVKVGMIPGTETSIASFMDITTLKQAQEVLKESEEYLRKENIRLKSSIKDRYRFGQIVGKSHVMQEVYELILKAASTDANVIIYGESGTGKELVAKAIHDISDRKQSAFIVVNCGAIPENLLESEFFGYKRGAFTGAESDKHGYLDLANGGTLFLDELGEISLNMQVKLLRVVEGRGYIPVGGREEKFSDIRIIAATNRNLRRMVNTGLMREDFFYRIHIIPIYMPPLRERKEDLLFLIEHFLSVYDPKTLPPITGRIMDAIQKYHWPGNVRELQNTLHRYVTLKKFDIMGTSLAADDIQQPVSHQILQENRDLRSALEDFEKQLILDSLEKNKYHRGKAAAALGINRRTLYKKMKIFGLIQSQPRNDRSHT
jgi:PAS domain S-box-containing protein